MKNLFKQFKVVKGHREYYFILALALILVLIVFSIVIILFENSTPPANVNLSPTPASTSFNPTTVPYTQPPTLHNINIQAASELVTREEQRVPLSSSDQQAKARILQLLPSGQNYGSVYSSTTIDIEYVQSLDLFDVYILTTDVASAKQEAETWFKQQGMSQQGICDLPLGFYLNSDVAKLMDTTNFNFSPLPDGC